MRSLPAITIFTSFLFLAGFTTSHGQIGLGFSYLSPRATDWDELNLGDPGEKIFTRGFEVSLDYFFRMKNVRVEFYPELTYRTLNQDHALDRPASNLSATFYGLAFNVNLYPLDFYGDCDCPTFSKSAPGFEKGFFLQFGPGYGINVYQNQDRAIQNEDVQESLFFLGAGIGFDAGLSDFLTLTPMVRFAYYPDARWDELGPLFTPDDDVLVDSPIMLWRFGLKLGLRFDQ